MKVILICWQILLTERRVIDNNAQLVDTLYTWQGVNNALLRDRLFCQEKERVTAEKERRKALYELLELKQNLDKTQESMQKKALDDAKMEADKILDGFEEDICRILGTRLNDLRMRMKNWNMKIVD